MKEFWIYTGLRVLLFIGSAGLVAGLLSLTTDRVNVLVVVLVAALVSSVASWKLLAGPRDRLAARVQYRAEQATARFEEARTREDVD